jgi:hypothetical protein
MARRERRISRGPLRMKAVSQCNNWIYFNKLNRFCQRAILIFRAHRRNGKTMRDRNPRDRRIACAPVFASRAREQSRTKKSRRRARKKFSTNEKRAAKKAARW